MNIDLGKFKKVAEDKHSATLLHPKGHQIKIAKRPLSDKLKAQLASLPHYVEGGGVSSDSNQTSSDPNASYDPSQQQQPQQSPQSPVNIVINGGAQPPPPQVAQAPAPAPAPAALAMPAPAQDSQPMVSYPPRGATGSWDTPAQPQANDDPYGVKTTSDVFNEGLQNRMQGLQSGADAEIGQNHALAGVYQQGIAQQQQMLQQTQQHQQTMMNEYQNVKKDVQNNMIDPNHYLNSMGTGQKIMTAIGLLAGGFGALAHQSNGAMDFINKQIDNDIQAQYHNQNARQNLVSASINMMGEDRLGLQFASTLQKGIIADQMKAAALKSNDPMVRARLLQQSGEMEMQNAQTIGQLAVRKTMLGQPMAQGDGSLNNPAAQISPEQKIAFLAQNPQEAEAAGKELQSMKNHAQQTDNILNAFDQANQTNTIGNRVAHAGFAPASVGVLQSLMMPYLKDAEGRINESELDRTDKLIPAPGDQPDKIAEKRLGLQQFLQEKAPAPVLLPRYGINPQQFGKLTPQGKRKLQLGAPVR